MTLLKYIEKDFKSFIFAMMMGFWALTATIQLLLKEDKVILLQMNGLDTRVVDKSELAPAEIENFLYNFVALFYSYGSKNYEEHMNRAANLIEMDLLKKVAPKINKMFDVVSSKPIVQTSFVERIFKIKDFDYEIDMRVQRHEDGSEKQSNYKIRMNLEKVERTLENPYGLIITRLEEFYE